MKTKTNVDARTAARKLSKSLDKNQKKLLLVLITEAELLGTSAEALAPFLKVAWKHAPSLPKKPYTTQDVINKLGEGKRGVRKLLKNKGHLQISHLEVVADCGIEFGIDLEAVGVVKATDGRWYPLPLNHPEGSVQATAPSQKTTGINPVA